MSYSQAEREQILATARAHVRTAELERTVAQASSDRLNRLFGLPPLDEGTNARMIREDEEAEARRIKAKAEADRKAEERRTVQQASAEEFDEYIDGRIATAIESYHEKMMQIVGATLKELFEADVDPVLDIVEGLQAIAEDLRAQLESLSERVGKGGDNVLDISRGMMKTVN